MVDAQLEILKQANEMEKLAAKASSYLDCFKVSNAKRTTIGIMVWLIQILNGSGLTGYATVLFVSFLLCSQRFFGNQADSRAP